MNTTTVVETQAVAPVEDKAAQIAEPAHSQAQTQAQAAAQAAQPEPDARADATPAVSPEDDAPAAELRFIALSRLRLSKRDVRKTRAPVDALAESIFRVGLLQNLIVVPVAGEDGEYEVVAGGRRHAALRLLAKKKRIARDGNPPAKALHPEVEFSR